MKTRFTLPAYTATAIAFMSGIQMNGQVVYFDVDPDVVLDTDGETFAIDLDDDGMDDLVFNKESGTASTFYSGYIAFSAINAGAFDDMGNGFLGNIESTVWFAQYFPYVLEAGDVIDEHDNFNNFDNTLMFKGDDVDGVVDPVYSGYWHNADASPIAEKYIGFQWDAAYFKRYGWIRCSVIDSGKTFIIHDYAIEMSVGHPIAAGDTNTYVGIHNTDVQNSLLVYTNSYSLTVDYHATSPAILSIYDIAGRIIYSAELTSTKTQIDTENWMQGVYLVVVRDEKKTEQVKCLVH